MHKLDIYNKIITYEKVDKKLKLAVEEKINKHKYCVVRGLFQKSEIKKINKKIFLKLNKKKNNYKNKLNPLKNSFEFKFLKKSDKVKKYAVEIFNPFVDKDIYGLHGTFKKLIKIRNLLYSIKNLSLEKYKFNKQNFFTSNRVLIYPSNKGFIEQHYDNNAASYTLGKFQKYFQVILNLSKKNVDFDYGGSTIYTKKKKVNLDNFLDYGDVLIYNQKIKHGVDLIRSRQSKKKGKISVLVTFYKKIG